MKDHTEHGVHLSVNLTDDQREQIRDGKIKITVLGQGRIQAIRDGHASTGLSPAQAIAGLTQAT